MGETVTKYDLEGSRVAISCAGANVSCEFGDAPPVVLDGEVLGSMEGNDEPDGANVASEQTAKEDVSTKIFTLDVSWNVTFHDIL